MPAETPESRLGYLEQLVPRLQQEIAKQMVLIEGLNEALRKHAVSGQLPNNLILYRQAKKLNYAEFCEWTNTKLGNLR